MGCLASFITRVISPFSVGKKRILIVDNRSANLKCLRLEEECPTLLIMAYRRTNRQQRL